VGEDVERWGNKQMEEIELLEIRNRVSDTYRALFFGFPAQSRGQSRSQRLVLSLIGGLTHSIGTVRGPEAKHLFQTNEDILMVHKEGHAWH